MFPAKWALSLLALILNSAAVSTGQRYVVHEKRTDHNLQRYSRIQVVPRDAIIPVRIGLTQSNLEHGHDHLMDISDPSSRNYGRHWSASEVEAMFAPARDSYDTVLQWLSEHGVHDARQLVKGWVSFEAPVQLAEDLFQTHFYEYDSRNGEGIRIGADEYSLPDHISQHVDYITPGVKLTPMVTKTIVSRKSEHHSSTSSAVWTHPHGRPDIQRRENPDRHSKTPPPGYGHLPPDLQACGVNITPPCVRALYSIPFPQLTIDSGTLGVYEAAGAYAQKDLDEFFSGFAPYVPNGTAPTLASINGGKAPVSVKSASTESDVDLDIIYSLLGAQPVLLYQVDNPPKLNDTGYTGNALTDFLLDAVDGSYCSDQDRSSGADCGTTSLTQVLSVSYVEPEIDSPYKANNRACNEFMKLGLQGHTVLYASGDYGVSSNLGLFGLLPCDFNGCISRNVSGTQKLLPEGPIFNPSFPASCPYVLSVGATQLSPNDTVFDAESSMFQPDLGPQQANHCPKLNQFFSSSGGFSNMFPRPTYQSAAVDAYFAHHDPGYSTYNMSGTDIDTASRVPKGVYNRIGRGFPDVAANGANFQSIVGDVEGPVFGTSLATPIWAAILTRINQLRKNAGKGPVGFVNPVLYSRPDIFNDITNGSNPGCGTAGFTAVPGWDPVTGLGTPNYPKLEQLFMSLP